MPSSPSPPPSPSPPLGPDTLELLALTYAARFATSAAKLEAYLLRKIRQRGWTDTGDSDSDSDAARACVVALVQRCVAAGYVDDAGFARMRAEGLLRRGYGVRRITAALSAAGIAEDMRRDALPDGAAARRAALMMARKRRFGPWSDETPDLARARKQVAALLRAGHPPDFAHRLIHAGSVEEAQIWADEGET